MKTRVLLSARSKTASDILVAGMFSDGSFPAALTSLESGFAASAKAAVKRKRFTGAFAETFITYSDGFRHAPEIILIGLGKKKDYKELCCRKAAGQALKLLRERKLQHLGVLLESFAGGSVKTEQAAGIFTEIGTLATYQFDRYKTREGKKKAPERPVQCTFLIEKAQTQKGAEKAAARATVLAEATCFTRDLINEPANVLNPTKMAGEARKMAAKSGLRCQIMTEPQLRKLKMGGILGVNQGSPTPPALIILEHGRQYQKKGTVCLVGKGVTFDTGGLSIKPSKGMEKMKYDMSGAAAVLGAMQAVGRLKLPVHVVALAPAVENNVAKDPQRPGDIIRMHNGKTVEVLNTDAEGRLILADALAYSEKFKPRALIDLATLTGMCLYTFGNEAVAMMGNDEKLLSRIKQAGEETGERCWPLPMWENYGKQVQGTQSDLKNIGGPYGGTITAAMFLKEFVPADTPWVHLDIAGTAWCDSPRYDAPVGATGVGVRLLANLLENWR